MLNKFYLSSLLLCCSVLSAQEVKVNALVDLWYTQMLNDNLRLDAPAKYYQLNPAFQENGFTVRRSEIYVAGKISDELSYNVMFDPNLASSASNPTILQDAFITWKPLANFSVKVGQFKPLQTFEASLAPRAGQIGEQGGDSIVAALQVGF